MWLLIGLLLAFPVGYVLGWVLDRNGMLEATAGRWLKH